MLTALVKKSMWVAVAGLVVPVVMAVSNLLREQTHTVHTLITPKRH
jgi:hypothetical protein